MAVDELEGTFLGGEGDVSDGGEHDDAADHGEGLDPEEGVARDDSEVEGAGEGAASEGDGSLKPAGSGDFGVGEKLGDSALIGDGIDDIELVLLAVGVAHGC